MKRYHIRLLFQRDKGFTLIELILTLAIASIIISPIYSILLSTTNVCMRGEAKDELILNGSYAIEYIKNEIRSADIVASTDKVYEFYKKYPHNLGFVLVFIDEDKYKYVSYHMKNDKIVRIGRETSTDKYPIAANLSGNNEVCRFIEDISLSYLDTKNKMIHLDFKLKSQGKSPIYYRVKSDVYIRSRIDF